MNKITKIKHYLSKNPLKTTALSAGLVFMIGLMTTTSGNFSASELELSDAEINQALNEAAAEKAAKAANAKSENLELSDDEISVALGDAKLTYPKAVPKPPLQSAGEMRTEQTAKCSPPKILEDLSNQNNIQARSEWMQNDIDDAHRKQIFSCAASQNAADFLNRFKPEITYKVFTTLSEGQIVHIVEAMDPNVASQVTTQYVKNNLAVYAVMILNYLPPEKAGEILSKMQPKDAAKIIEVLSIYDKMPQIVENMTPAALTNVFGLGKEDFKLDRKAFVMNYLNPDKGAEIITNLPLEKAAEIFITMLKKPETSHNVSEIKKRLTEDVLNELTFHQINYKAANTNIFQNFLEKLSIQTAYAETDPEAIAVRQVEVPTKNTKNDTWSNFLNKINDFLSAIFLCIYYFFFWPLVQVISMLLSDDFIMGSEIQPTLNYIWITIRDLVNIGFVFMLLIIASANIIGFEKVSSKFNLKESVIKIIVAIVAVNFTWFGCKVAIDISNVATTAVASIGLEFKESETAQKVQEDPGKEKDPLITVAYNLDSSFIGESSCKEWASKCVGYATQASGGVQGAVPFTGNYNYLAKEKASKIAQCEQAKNTCIDRSNSGISNRIVMEIVDESGKVQNKQNKSLYFNDMGSKPSYDDINKYYLKRDGILLHVVLQKDKKNESRLSGKENKNKLPFYMAKYFANLLNQKDDEDQDSMNSIFNMYGIKENDDSISLIRSEAFTPEAKKEITDKGEYAEDSDLKAKKGEVTNFIGFLGRNFFVAFIFIALFFSLLALTVVLIARVAIVWIVVMFSPAIAFGLIAGSDGGDIQKGARMALKAFIEFLLVPVKVMAVFAIVFILAHSFSNLFAPDIPDIMQAIFDFISGKTDPVEKTVETTDGGHLNLIQYIIFLTLIIVILWKGAFWAMKGAIDSSDSSLLQGITGGIEHAGEWVMKSPKHLPIPVPGLQGMSIGAALGAPKAFAENRLQMQVNKDRAAYKKLGIVKEYGATTSKDAAQNAKGDHKKFFSTMEDGGSISAKEFQGLSKKEAQNHLEKVGIINADKVDIKEIQKGNTTEFAKLETKNGKIEESSYRGFAKNLENARKSDNKNTAATAAGTAATLVGVKAIENLAQEVKDANGTEQVDIVRKATNKTTKDLEDEDTTTKPEEIEKTAKILEKSLENLNDKSKVKTALTRDTDTDRQTYAEIIKALAGEMNITITDPTNNQPIVIDPDAYANGDTDALNKTLDAIQDKLDTNEDED